MPVPGYGTGRLDVEGNLAAYLDRAILGTHTWKHKPGWDPEGVLSTIPAIATTLFGILAGEWLRSARDWKVKLTGLMAAGAKDAPAIARAISFLFIRISFVEVRPSLL